MTLVQGQGTPLGHEQQLCALISNPIRGYEVMAQTRCEQTDGWIDRHAGSFLYTPQTLFAGGINITTRKAYVKYKMPILVQKV